MDSKWELVNLNSDFSSTITPIKKDQSNLINFVEIPGLSLLPNAITDVDEHKILAKILARPWTKAVSDKSRQVQQYGMLYNYQTRSMSSTYVPIPNWLVALADVLDLPHSDNVIINKY